MKIEQSQIALSMVVHANQLIKALEWASDAIDREDKAENPDKELIEHLNVLGKLAYDNLRLYQDLLRPLEAEFDPPIGVDLDGNL